MTRMDLPELNEYATTGPHDLSITQKRAQPFLIRVVEWETAAKSQRAHQRGMPEISERLRRVGWGRRGSARALEPEFLDAGLEGGGFEAQERGGAGSGGG